MSILMCGACYCPLSPDQPLSRLNTLIEQVQPTCVLVHTQTNALISSKNVNIAQVLLLSNLSEWTEDEVRGDMQAIAYMIFTSGSTSTPKIVPISHENFDVCINALAQSAIMMDSDTVLQTTPSSFDIHMQEILGTLWLGGSVCLLRPNGNFDMNYWTSVVQRQEISFVISVPTFFTSVIQYIERSTHQQDLLATVRRLCSIGKFSI